MELLRQLIEMATAAEMSSGAWKRNNALELVRNFIANDVPLDIKNQRYTNGGKVIATKLAKGMKVLAMYNSTNQGVDPVEILGVTSSDNETHPEYSSVEEALKKLGVASLKAADEAGHDIRVVCKDLDDGDTGAWYYIYKGRFARGSGAEPLTFYKLSEASQ